MTKPQLMQLRVTFPNVTYLVFKKGDLKAISLEGQLPKDCCYFKKRAHCHKHSLVISHKHLTLNISKITSAVIYIQQGAVKLTVNKITTFWI